MKKNKWITWVLLLVCMLMPLRSESAKAASNMIKAGKIGVPGNTGKALPGADSRNLRGGRSPVRGFSYGSQLAAGNETAVYNALKNTVDMRRYSENEPLVVHLPKQYTFSKSMPYYNSIAWKTLYKEIERAIDAYYMDYCEDYWVGGFQFYLANNCQMTGKFEKIGLGPIDYYSGIRSELGMTDIQMQKAINEVSGRNRYEVVKSAHDYIMNRMTYPEVGIFGSAIVGDKLYYHVITGGLLEKYRYTGVCDCYARLFQLICRAKGIPSVLAVGGSERDGKGNIIDNHIWNYVQMEDGKWYLVDCTWDDNILEQYGKEGNPYTYFLAGSNSKGIVKDTVREDHMAVGRLSDNVAYASFFLPVLSKDAYVYRETVPVQPSNISINKSGLSLKCGQMAELNFSVSPVGAQIYNLKWITSNSNVVRISTMTGRPVVRAVSGGNAVITAAGETTKAACQIKVNHIPGLWKVTKAATGSSEGKREQKCSGCGKTIAVQTIPKTYVKLNAESVPLQYKKSTTALKIVSFTSGDRVKAWKSSNPKVVTVSSKGKLTAKRVGSATITVTMTSGASAKCQVTVQKGAVKTRTLKLTRASIELKKGQTYRIGTIRTPITAADKVTYSSSNKKIAAITSSGKLTAKRAGNVNITVRSGSKKAILKVMIK